MTRHSRPANSSGSESGHPANVQTYIEPPEAPDGGWGWIIVTASFVINCIVDGVCFSFGIFYIQLLEEFKESSAKTSLIGALLSGMYLIVGPLVGGLTNKYGCRSVTIAGSLVASASIFASSFSVDLNMLIVTYGVLTGIGFGMMYLPSIVIVGFYFEKRRALATGIAVCGSGIGTFIFAPFGSLLLDYFGWRGGNQILAGVVLNGVVCGAVFRPLKPRPRRDMETKAVTVAERVADRPRRRFIPKRGLIMQKIIDEKQRQRTISTGSLDGTIITKDNRLVKPSEISLHESLHSLKVSAVLETIPEVNPDCRPVPLDSTPSSAAGQTALDEGSINTDSNLPYDGSAQKCEVRQAQIPDPPKYIAEANDFSGSGEPFISNLTLSFNGEIHGRKDTFPSTHTSVTVLNKPRPMSWLSTMSNNEQPDTEMTSEMRSQTTRPLYRHDTFYSGSVLNIPDVKRNPEITSFVSIPSVNQTGSRRMHTVNSNQSPVAAVCKMMLDFSLAKSFTFVLLCTALVLPFLGFFTPFMYLTPYAMSLGVRTDDATVLLSILGLSNALARLVVGFLADRPWVDCVLVHNAALVFAGIMTCVVPVLSTYDLLCIYAVLFGVCIAAFVTLKSILLVELLGLQKLTTAFGLVGLFQGFSTLIGGTLAGAVHDFTGSYVDSFLMAGSMIATGGLLCLPIRKVVRWEARRRPRDSKSPAANYIKSPG